MNINPNRGNSRMDKRMNAITKTTSILALLVTTGLALAAGTVNAAEPPKSEHTPDLDKLVGQPADLSPWAYAWRADREVQEKPEAYFIPRRLERLDKVYRTLWSKMTETERANDAGKLYSGLLPAPKGGLLSALLWLAPVPRAQRIELRWTEGSAVPPVEAIEVRVYPSKAGWFGFVRDEVLPAPAASADGRTWTYANERKDPATGKVSALFEGTDMVAVFFDPGKAPAGTKYGCPTIHLYRPHAKWSTLDVEIEWGFKQGAEEVAFDGRIEAYYGYVKSVKPLPEDEGTTMAGADAWKSSPAPGGARRGIAVSLLYPGRFGRRPGISPLDTRITLWTKGGNLTFVPDDVNTGPVLVPGLGMFVTKAGGKTTARQFAADLAARNLKTIPQLTREHPEAASWEEVMRHIRLMEPTLPPIVPVEDPPMQVRVPDERWPDAWRRAALQLKNGPYSWWTLAEEVARPINAMDLVGLHEVSAKHLDYWLKTPGVKPDGDFVDGEGGLEYAKSMKYGIGWSHDGTLPSTGKILFTLAERYFLSGDKQWFQKNRARMQAAADWIIRQRELYLKDIPNRQNLAVAGLQPPQMATDIGHGTCRWFWHLFVDGFSYQGLRRFADALSEVDAEAGKKYSDAADAYRADILRAVEREIATSPVRRVRDGTYRSYIPSTVYTRGMFREVIGDYSFFDVEQGALPLADAFGAMDPNDDRIGSHLEIIEENLMPLKEQTRVADDENWFYNGFAGQCKVSYVADVYLLRDDVPCFLRHLWNNYAGFAQMGGGFSEHCAMKGKKYEFPGPDAKPAGDSGSTGWFVKCFRNLLVMEDGQSLWLARATPRAWLEQGKKISIKNAPTHFGAVSYEIASDVDNGKITATVELPARKAPKEVVLRFRHPKAAPIKAVTVNGKPWTEYNKDKETITLPRGLTGNVAVTAQY